MEKIEKHLVNSTFLKGTKKNNNIIRASTILEITLEDYHQSRRLYGQASSNINFEKNNEENTNERMKNKFFEEFEEESGHNEYSYNNVNKKVSLSKLNTKEINKNTLKISENTKEIQSKNSNDKSAKIKNLIFNYIKEKELDM